MALDAEELEFERELADKRHNEIVDVLKAIKIPEQKDSTKFIVNLEDAIRKLSDKVSKIEQPNIVTEKTTINQTEVVNSLNEMIKEFKSLKDSLTEKKSPKEWEFNVVRNNFGFIQSVTAKQIEP